MGVLLLWSLSHYGLHSNSYSPTLRTTLDYFMTCLYLIGREISLSLLLLLLRDLFSLHGLEVAQLWLVDCQSLSLVSLLLSLLRLAYLLVDHHLSLDYMA